MYISPPRPPSPRKLAAEHFKEEIVNGTRWNKLRWSLDLYEYHVHRNLLYSYNQDWNASHCQDFGKITAEGGIEQSLRFFGARFIDTRQKSMNEKHYITETLDFHIQLAKAGFNLMGLVFFLIYRGNFIKTKISMFLFPRIDTWNASQSNELVKTKISQFSFPRVDTKSANQSNKLDCL